MPQERELKFSLRELPDAGSLQGALAGAGFTVEASGKRVQNDTYFDTPEGALERAGLALRVREVQGARLATLKAAGEVKGGLHDREELELPLQDDWPEPIRARLEGFDAASLKPHLLLRTKRTRYLVLENTTELAELALDEVTARRPAGGEEARFLELEIEARAGSDEDLRRIAGVLGRSLTLTPEARTKPKHAHALLGRK